ncbi:hypothetical protein GQ53DRAFT_262782 [Thozetella sp. PMI_491]|nr:hypothetical protein GQ53DRAFT_262782 [Thozetella sp. PMI_491]
MNGWGGGEGVWAGSKKMGRRGHYLFYFIFFSPSCSRSGPGCGKDLCQGASGPRCCRLDAEITKYIHTYIQQTPHGLHSLVSVSAQQEAMLCPRHCTVKGKFAPESF